MTISSSDRQAGPFTGNDTATVFPFSFKVFTASDLYVVRLNSSTGIETELTLNTDYTVSLNADQDSSPGGSVTLPAVLATGYTLTLTSQIPETQGAVFTNLGAWYPAVINNALDKLTILIQQALIRITKSLRFPLSDSPTVSATLPAAGERALKYLAFDSTGAPIATAGTADSTPISTYMKTVNASADAPTARGLLDVPSTSQTKGKAVAMAIVFGG